jgi:hypothetical protein
VSQARSDLRKLNEMGITGGDTEWWRAHNDALRIVTKNHLAWGRLVAALCERKWPAVMYWPEICELFPGEVKIFNCVQCDGPIDFTSDDFAYLPGIRGFELFFCGPCVA